MIKGTNIKLISYPCLTLGRAIKFDTLETNTIQEGDVIEFENDDKIHFTLLDKKMKIISIKKEDGFNRYICQIVEEIEVYQKDNINPDHYKHGTIETIDYLVAISKDMHPQHVFCISNAIKYLSRFHKKNGIEDVKKAQWYVNKLIEIMEKDK